MTFPFKKPQKLYDCTTVQNLISKYDDKGGYAIQTDEGGCGCGNWILYGKGLKTCIIQEYAVSSWSSLHSIRFYNKTPKKYQAIIDNF